MRIGLIIYGSLETLTGGYLYDRIVARELVRRGHAVEVIDLNGGGYLERLALAASPRLRRRLLTGGFDVIIEDELCHPSLFFVNRELRRLGGPPVVALVHQVMCDEPRRRWQNVLLAVPERCYLRSVDGFIHNSAATQRTVAGLVAHKRPQVIARPAGDRLGGPLAREVIERRARRPGPLELIFLGNVIPRKGLLPLLRALAAVDRELWRLTVVGGLDFDPGYAAKAGQLARQLGLSDSVRFMGALQGNAVAAMLEASHLFCMPYAYEGFGIAIVEAMAFGLPAVGCRDGAAGETIRHGRNGFLLAPGNIAGLAPLLTRLHRDRQTLLRMALAARRTYSHHPTWHDSVVAIERFIARMKERHQRAQTARASGNPKKKDSHASA